jgi:protein-tyrosine phosphatase
MMAEREHNNRAGGHERLLAMENLFNMRDLGGYPGGLGRVKWGLLYRAGDLCDASAGDRARLEACGIKTIVDFRSDFERQRAPDCLVRSVEYIFDLAIEAGNMMGITGLERHITPEMLMEEMYRHIAGEAVEQYREFFRILSLPSSAPVLFHCTAGKDRTGFGAALILSALGTDRRIIMEDYLLSGEYLRERYRDFIEREPHLEPMMSVRRSYLETAFAVIDRKFGGMEQYLAGTLGVNAALLRELYTEPAAG